MLINKDEVILRIVCFCRKNVKLLEIIITYDFIRN